jgi:antitoxin ParD1/3/4
MLMEIAIDPQRRRFVTSKVRSGRFKSASDVIKFAIDRMRQDERDLARLKKEIQKGITSLDNGEGTPWDVEEAKARFLRRVKRNRGAT